MRKLLVFILAVGMFASCNSDKTKEKYDRDTKSTQKDDYRSNSDQQKKPETTEETNTKPPEQEPVTDKEEPTTNADYRAWRQQDRDDFTNSCVSRAVGGGMTRLNAESYCSCMCNKIESLYPNTLDVVKLTKTQLEQLTNRYISECMQEH